MKKFTINMDEEIMKDNNKNGLEFGKISHRSNPIKTRRLIVDSMFERIKKKYPHWNNDHNAQAAFEKVEAQARRWEVRMADIAAHPGNQKK